MDRYKFRCKNCQGTKLRKTQAGGYACADCGRQPDTMMPSSMVVNEAYVKSAANVRSRGYVVEKNLTEKQETINDLEYHLEEKWLDYLQYFQEALKYNITQLQERLGLDPQLKEITKKIWLKYLDKWSQSKRRIVGFFSVTRKGLYKGPDQTFPKRKYNESFDYLEEVDDFEDDEEMEEEGHQAKPQTQEFNFDMIFSQMTQVSDLSKLSTQPVLDREKGEKKAEQTKIKKTRKEFYSTRYWVKEKDEKEKLKRKPTKGPEGSESSKGKTKHEKEIPKKKSFVKKDLFSQNPRDFLMNIHHYYIKISKITISQIIEDYNQILNFQKGDNKEKIKSLKRRASYLKVDYLQSLLKERKIEPENLKLCDSRQTFQKMAKDLIFIHDYFCFAIYRHAELVPISLSSIMDYIEQVSSSNEEDETDMTDPDKKKNEEALIKLAKEYISRHMIEEQEMSRPKKLPKLFPLEHNLIPLICLVALRLAKYPVFPRDIIQWIRYRIMPFFTAHLEIPAEGLKEYLIRPMNIPSSSWLRSSFKKFIKIYEIEWPTKDQYAEKLIERVFLDCEIPHSLLTPCLRLYNVMSLIRRDYKHKSIDEDIVVLSVILATLKLFYGFDDNFYGVFLKMDKVQEVDRTLGNEELKDNLLNMMNVFDRFRDKDPVIKCITSIPKFDDAVQKWQNKISTDSFDSYFPVEGVPLAWDYKDLRNINKDNVYEYLETVKKNIYSEDNQSEFAKLQGYFERIDLGTSNDIEMSESHNNMEIIKTKVDVSKDIDSKRIDYLKERNVSKFFSEEIKFFSDHYAAKNGQNGDQSLNELVDLPLPCDNYFIYNKFKSIPQDRIKHEFLFLLNIFSSFLQEPLENIQKGLKFVDKHLLKLVSLLED